VANTLTEVIPKLLAQGLMALRENAVTPRLVNRQYEREAGMKGSTIDVPIPSAIAVLDVAPANVAPDPGNTQPTSVPIPLDQWKEAPFFLSDKDMLEAVDDIMPMQASEAIKSLANTVDVFIQELGKQFYWYTGTAGTTPFSSGTTVDSTNARKLLNQGLAPLDDRWALLDPDAEASALNVRAFQDMSWNGSPDTIINGNLNRKMGFGWWMNQNVLTHTTSGPPDDYTVVGAHIVGVTSIAVVSAANDDDFTAGDILTFAGHTQTYVVTADVAGEAAAIVISPPLRVALAGSEAITVVDTHVNNLLFHRQAIAFASRPLQNHGTGLGVVTASAVDPVSGLALRVETKLEHKRLRFSYDILFGGALIRPGFGVRLAG
jgi:hypothetical protein